jgi:predicted RNase H-like nuclease
MLQRFVGELESRCPRADFCPEAPATPGRPAIREVYPNALQVRLFDLDRPPVRKKHVYKRQKFGSKRKWVARGLGPFVEKCAATVESRRYVAQDRIWKTLVRERPRAAETGPALKALEDRWDALLCAIAVALDQLQRGTMHAYTGPEPGSWREGYILAPVLRPSTDRRTS